MTDKTLNVSATVAICFYTADEKLIPFGSGINVDPSGIIVTCKHVIEGALVDLESKKEVLSLPRPEKGRELSLLPMQDIVAVFSFFQNGSLEIGIARFEILHGLHDYDLAVGRLKPDTELPYLEMGDSDDIYECELVFTCGFPLGPDLQPRHPVGALFHRGIVSGIRPHAFLKPRYEFLLDMSVNPGNSGGPLCTEETGKVVGIVNALIQNDSVYNTGIGCAIPINIAQPLVKKIASLSSEHIEGIAKGIWPSNLNKK